MSYVQELFDMFIEQDQSVKDKKRDFLKTHVIPFFMEKLDETAQKNNGHLALSMVHNWMFYARYLANSKTFIQFLVNLGRFPFGRISKYSESHGTIRPFPGISER